MPILKQLILSMVLLAMLAQSTMAKPVAGNPLKRLEKLYQQKDYVKLLQEIKQMEREGRYRSNRYYPKYANNWSFYTYKVKAHIQLLLLETKPSVQKARLRQVIKHYEHLAFIDGQWLHPQSDDALFDTFKQYVADQAEAAYLNNQPESADHFTQFIIRNWHDTIPVYYQLYYPKSPKLIINQNAYATVDSFASAPIRFKVQSTRQLTKFLTDSFPSDLLKARSIYTYLATHIIYDYESYNNGWHLNGRLDDRNSRDGSEPVKLRAILIRKQGICSDFAQVFQEMCQYAGVQVGELYGLAKGSEWQDNLIYMQSSNHAWNYVVVNKSDTLLLDVCWAACTQRLDFYFASNPAHFIYSHLPEDTAFQLLHRPITKEEFIRLPLGSAYYFEGKSISYLDELSLTAQKAKHWNTEPNKAKARTTHSPASK
jgi:hypothetical protein